MSVEFKSHSIFEIRDLTCNLFLSKIMHFCIIIGYISFTNDNFEGRKFTILINTRHMQYLFPFVFQEKSIY